MAGSHRAERPRGDKLPRWAIVAAVVVALLPAVYFSAQRMFAPAEPAAVETRLPIPPVSSNPPSAGASPTSSPSPTADPAPDLPRVPAASPRRLTSGSALDTGFDESVEPEDGVLSARSDAEVARWGSRGTPASPGKDTVVVVGRMRAGEDTAFAGLDRLRKGSKVAIRTDTGRLTYTVDSSGSRPEPDLLDDTDLTAKTPGRLVLVGVRYDDSGNRLDEALVVVATLTAAARS